MAETLAPQEKILVLILGGTINGDWEKTLQLKEDPKRPMTHVEPYRDSRGRMPIQIYIEDVLALPPERVEIVEISDKDSKALSEKEFREADRHIRTAVEKGFTRILYVMGTDDAITAGSRLEHIHLHPKLPLFFVMAMKEMTRDMDRTRGVFTSFKTDGIRSLKRAMKSKLGPGFWLWADDKRAYVSPLEAVKDYIAKRFVSRQKSGALEMRY